MLLHDYSDDPPFFFIAKVLKLQSKYEQAIHVLVPVIDKYPIKESNWTDEKLSLEALVQYGNTKNPKAIYDHILYLRKKYKKLLPPRKMAAGTPEMVAATIFRLYEHIGDFDGGVKFAEEFLKYYKKLGPGNPYQLGNPYFRVIQEFQIDKQEGFKCCADAKSGDTCMGHVTRYIIQSDFFPW